MSRLGKIPVAVPAGVKINVQKSVVLVEGPKGKIDLKVPEGIKIEMKDQQIQVNRLIDTKQGRANHGTVRSHLVNMIEGVTTGHKKNLEIQGVGFRAQIQGNKITFNIGFSHPVEYIVPENVKALVPTLTSLSIEGVDKTLVGRVASSIRSLKPAEPYKGKGIRYAGEIVRRKQGKSVTK